MTFRLFVLCLFTIFVLCDHCATPPPAEGYKINNYLGKWYEMGKYQTEGGAFFERDCTCTESDIGVSSQTAYTYNSCVKNGKRTGINATLLPTDIDGHYVEKFSVNKANYYVIYLDDNYAIEYDCSESFGIVNYCVHIMSKTLTVEQSKI